MSTKTTAPATTESAAWARVPFAAVTICVLRPATQVSALSANARVGFGAQDKNTSGYALETSSKPSYRKTKSSKGRPRGGFFVARKRACPARKGVTNSNATNI